MRYEQRNCSTLSQKKGHEITVPLLLSKEADIQSRDQYKETHLHKARLVEENMKTLCSFYEVKELTLNYATRAEEKIKH